MEIVERLLYLRESGCDQVLEVLVGGLHSRTQFFLTLQRVNLSDQFGVRSVGLTQLALEVADFGVPLELERLVLLLEGPVSSFAFA